MRPEMLSIHEEVAMAINHGDPVVALESTLITHGLPYPQNIEIAQAMERNVRENGAIPATIAVLEGLVHVGLSNQEMEYLARTAKPAKISTRDIATAIWGKLTGGTTVAGTMRIASIIGISVFATGGIGGVHRPSADLPVSYDISADLVELSRTPVLVICAGAKAILDIRATLEYLETMSVPVIGYGSHDFPAFYSRSSGINISQRADSAAEIARITRAHWGFGMQSGIIVANPLPEDRSVSAEVIENAVHEAIHAAETRGIHGQDVTPYLLAKVSELTHGRSMEANLFLLQSNAKLAARIAVELSQLAD